MQTIRRSASGFIERIPFLRGAIPIVYSHHEKWDGSGYPRGLSGADIPLGARIFAVVDAFDAMTFDRPYSKAIAFEAAQAEIKRCAGTHFDPEVVEAFLRVPARCSTRSAAAPSSSPDADDPARPSVRRRRAHAHRPRRQAATGDTPRRGSRSGATRSPSRRGSSNARPSTARRTAAPWSVFTC